MDGKSLSPQEEKIKQLQTLFPEIVAEGKINWNQLRATLGSYIDTGNERYGLSWAGKSEAFQTLQTPIPHTLVPDPDASTNFNTTKNIFIEGENLDVLKVLQRSYFGKVKMIYIDPPYNTGNDAFVYNDHYTDNRLHYEKKAGDKDANGHKIHESILRKNTKDKGHYHSNWLNMMYPRLFLAKSLLQDDGVIFVSIDDHEVHNLRLIMNEIFGEENFVGQGIRKTKSTTNDAKTGFNNQHEYFIIYAKHIKNIQLTGFSKDLRMYKNPDNDPNGPWASSDPSAKSGSNTLYYPIENPYTGQIDYPPNGRFWSFTKTRLGEWIKKGKIVFKHEHNKGQRGFTLKRYKNELQRGFHLVESLFPCNNSYMNQVATKSLNKLFKARFFDYPKPVIFVKNLICFSTNPNDLILDFFAGSATTAQAVMELNQEDGGNRRYICVQMAEPCDESSEAFQAGFHTIADIAKERIRRAAKKIQTTHSNYQGDLGFKVFSLQKSNFKQWQQPATRTEDALLTQMKAMITPLASHATDQSILYELLLKLGKSLNSPITNKGDYYLIGDHDHTLIVLLHKISPSLIEQIIKAQPQKVIALDQIFQGKDPLKTNTALQMKEANILFETI